MCRILQDKFPSASSAVLGPAPLSPYEAFKSDVQFGVGKVISDDDKPSRGLGFTSISVWLLYHLAIIIV